MSETSLRYPASACAALLVMAAVSASAAVSPSMEVHAIVERGDGKPAEMRVSDGGVLRSGDRLQVRVSAPQDGYIYVIAHGSSGSALLLHPFSGRTETARVRAGELMVVPAEGVYLPLDARPGRETLFAIWSPTPLSTLASLLVRMEGAAGDADAAEQILRQVYPDAQRVAFRHLDSRPLYGVDLVSTGMAMQYQATGTIAPLGERASAPTVRADPYAIVSGAGSSEGVSSANRPVVTGTDPVLQPSGTGPIAAEPDLNTLLLEPAEEEPVLGGVGSRLRAFESGQPTLAAPPLAPAASPPVPAAPSPVIGPGAPQQPVNEVDAPLSQQGPVETPVATTGLTAAIAALFGGGSKKPTDEGTKSLAASGGGNAQSSASSPARVLPLQEAAPARSASSPMLQLEVPVAAGASPAPATPAVVSEAPVAATDTSSSSSKTQAPDPSELGVVVPAVPVEVASSTPAPPPSTPVSSTEPPIVVPEPAATPAAGGPPVVAAAPAAQGVRSSPGLFGALSSLFEPSASTAPATGDAAPVATASTPAVEIASDSPASSSTPQTPARTVVSRPVTGVSIATTADGPAADATEVVQTEPAAVSTAAPSAPPPASVQRPAEAVADGGSSVAAAAAVDTPSDASSSSGDATAGGGLFSALGGWLTSSSSNPPHAPGGRREAATVVAPSAGGAEAGRAATSSPAPPSTGTSAESNVTASAAPPAAVPVVVAAPAAVEAPAVTAAPVEAPDTAAPTASAAGSSSGATAAAPAEAVTPAGPPVDTAAGSAGGGGLFSALGSLFSASSGNAPAAEGPKVEPEPARQARSVVSTPPAGRAGDAPAQSSGTVGPATSPASAVASESAPSATPERKAGGESGVFAALGGLFGFSDADSSKSEHAAGATAPTPAALPDAGPATPTEPEPLRPAINLEQGVVVRLDGPKPGQAPQPAGSGGVLAGEGNQIRALLGETPQPPSPASAPPAPAATAALAAAPATLSGTVAPAPSPASTDSRLTTAPAPATPSVAPAPTLTASVSAPSATVVVAPPLPGLGGDGAATVPVPQLATMSTAQSIDSARRLARGVVMVVTPEGSGSGALIDAAGHVLTNWHLVGAFNSVTVLVKDANGDVPASGQRIRARVVRFSKFADLALLKMDTVPDTAAPLTLGDATRLREGSMLHAIGHPDGGVWSHTPVIVTRVQDQGSWYSGQSFLHKAGVVSGQAHTDPGASGAALLDADMQLVALGAKATRRGDKVQAVSVDTIRSFLGHNGVAGGVAGGG